MSAGAWFGWLTVAGVLIVAGIYRIRKYGHAEGGEITPLDDLMDGPEQVGDDTLAMVADDQTAAEADIAPYSVYAANGPAVVAQGRALVADLDAWMDHLDVEAWLGERGWL